MSVTFTVPSAAHGLRVICIDGVHRDMRVWPTTVDVDTIDAEHMASCPSAECRETGGLTEVIHDIDVTPVDVARGHAIGLLVALGYLVGEGAEAVDAPEIPSDLDLPGLELVGEADGHDFLGRVLVALAMTPADAGVPACATSPTGLWVDCGRREGWLQDRLGELHVLALVAIDHGKDVIWA